MASSSIDSMAVSTKRLNELDLGDIAVKFAEFEWDAYGNFAYAIPVAAGCTFDDARFPQGVVRPLLSLDADAPELPRAAKLRRLIHKARALNVGDLRTKVDKTDAGLPRKLPHVEREARRARLAEKLSPALALEVDLDPAHSLIDRFMAMVDDDWVGCVPWSVCATRAEEPNASAAKKEVGAGGRRRHQGTERRADGSHRGVPPIGRSTRPSSGGASR